MALLRAAEVFFHVVWVVGCAIIGVAFFLLKWCLILIFLGRPGKE